MCFELVPRTWDIPGVMSVSLVGWWARGVEGYSHRRDLPSGHDVHCLGMGRELIDAAVRIPISEMEDKRQSLIRMVRPLQWAPLRLSCGSVSQCLATRDVEHRGLP